MSSEQGQRGRSGRRSSAAYPAAEQAKVPTILVLDERFTRNADDRRAFCAQAGVVDADDDAGAVTPATRARVYFHSGQTQQRNASGKEKYCCDYNEIKKYLRGVGEERLSLVLLNVFFSPEEVPCVRREEKSSGVKVEVFGHTFKKKMQDDFPELPVVFFSHESMDKVAALSRRAVPMPYLHKLTVTSRKLTEKLLRHGRLTPEQQRHLLGLDEQRIVAESPALLQVYYKAYVHADDDSPILLLGESGAGKEVLAGYIRSVSPRKEKPMKSLNVTALPTTLAESELFGHVAGAFTDAKTDKTGVFVEANEGVLFLDEIGDLSLEIQAKLLRAIETKKVKPLGATKSKSADVLLICATNANLAAKVRDGKFRPDLLHRIDAIPISIPPLRQRREDIIPLTHNFLVESQKKQGKVGITITAEAQEILATYDYPGNTRELIHIVARLVGRAGDFEQITADEVREAICEGLVVLETAPIGPGDSVSGGARPAQPAGSKLPLSELSAVLRQVAMPSARNALAGQLPELDQAFRDLLGRLVGCALDATATGGATRRYNLQGAMRLLTGKELTGRAPASLLHKIVDVGLGLDDQKNGSAKPYVKDNEVLHALVDSYHKG
ncbi:MAG: hypothetical protein BWK76_27850 [Desulfobulbaceae bacterium A2]|nr:MAG: hypothetical protein BWK76_27850 [Desulfobulbaceae bacterium A2]